MTEKITAETVSQTFNLAAIKPQVQEGYGFMVAIPPQQGGQEAYEAWASANETLKAASRYVEIPTLLPGLMGEAVLFKDQSVAEKFCADHAGNQAFGARINAISLSISKEKGAVVAAPLQWKQDKFVAIQAMMRK